MLNLVGHRKALVEALGDVKMQFWVSEEMTGWEITTQNLVLRETGNHGRAWSRGGSGPGVRISGAAGRTEWTRGQEAGEEEA